MNSDCCGTKDNRCQNPPADGTKPEDRTRYSHDDALRAALGSIALYQSILMELLERWRAGCPGSRLQPHNCRTRAGAGLPRLQDWFQRVLLGLPGWIGPPLDRPTQLPGEARRRVRFGGIGWLHRPGRVHRLLRWPPTPSPLECDCPDIHIGSWHEANQRYAILI